MPRLRTWLDGLRDQPGNADAFEHDVGLAAERAFGAADRVRRIDHERVGAHVERALFLPVGDVLHRDVSPRPCAWPRRRPRGPIGPAPSTSTLSPGCIPERFTPWSAIASGSTIAPSARLRPRAA